MNNQDHKWHLIAGKLTHEASREELEELQNMLQDDPDSLYVLELLTLLWKQPQLHKAEDADRAFERLLKRIGKQV